MVADIQARRALAFARLHDWGQDAFLSIDRNDEYTISGLIDGWTERDDKGNVSYHETIATVPATMRALKEFGNY